MTEAMFFKIVKSRGGYGDFCYYNQFELIFESEFLAMHLPVKNLEKALLFMSDGEKQMVILR
ncbi:hypothetical protein [Moraxella cuniculi]|uniref:Uncharacterized protein n=1 Tax=Moraxella cuniculi TaxID=34061 RepID=A0A448GTZ8_9GAMM|nr:hypothetical protein [Moraxella cuniculi]VEG12232.1 Uncharacterised protein [Moraxella cuniculi]